MTAETMGEIDTHHRDELTDLYWLGYRHGQRTALYSDLENREPALRRDLRLGGTTNRRHRAFALGELRGYRQTIDQPPARPRPDDRWRIER